MFRAALTTLAMVASSLLAGDAAAPPATPASAPAVNAPVVQPDRIPGPWKLAPQPLPPIAEILKRPAPALPVYGLYTWMGEYKQYRESFKKVGWKSYRVGGPFTDDDMRMILQDGAEVMNTLQVQNVPGADWNKVKKSRNDFASDEEFLTAYVKCVEGFLQRYGPGGTFFKDNPDLPNKPILLLEIWNEPNFQYMIPDSNDRSKDEAQREALYAKVLPAVHDAIKKKWPAVQVVGFGAGGAGAGDLRFIEHVLGLDVRAAKCMDILSTHPYVRPAPPEADRVEPWGSYSIARSLEAIRKTLAGHGVGDLPIWYTEIGWPISKAEGGYYDMRDKDPATKTLQAAYIVRLYALAMRLGVERVHIMHATDTDHYNGGIFLRDGTWRPAAQAVQTIIKMMPNPKITEAVSDGAEGFYAYAFDPDALAPRLRPPPPVLMAWNVTGPKTVDLPYSRTGEKAVVTDMLGNSKEVPVKDGKVSVEVGPCPIYIRALGVE